MFLIGLGNAFGWGFIILGGLRLSRVLIEAQTYGDAENYAVATVRYFGSVFSNGAIDLALVLIAAGVAFLLLTRAASRPRGASEHD